MGACKEVKVRFNFTRNLEFENFRLLKEEDIEKWCQRDFVRYEYDRSAYLDETAESYKKTLNGYKSKFFEPKVNKPFELMYVLNELQIGDKDWLSFVAQMQVKAKNLYH